ncbi:MAG: energy transducer TonB [Pseudomonadota bacterium]
MALAISIALHGLALATHFSLPESPRKKQKDNQLEVVLVNAKSARKPADAQAKAQANLDGGGNTDENRRAKTPLPASREARHGAELAETQRRVRELEAQQRKLLAQAQSKRSVQAAPQAAEKQPEPQPQVSGADLAQSALAIARMEAQIERSIEEYNKRPRKKNIGARTEEFRFAQYVEDWRQKVERVGNLNYPQAAKGKLYGSLLLSVIIRADGSVQDIQVDRSSGHRILDDAARRIIQLAAPFAPFPPDIRRDFELIEITRTWTFTNADRLKSD